MATFTMQLKEVIEYTDGDIGLDMYPIFDEAYRPGLNDKIIDHYYTQEIGVETIDMFRLAMRRRMNEIMPLYNQMLEAERRQVDPFSTVDLRTVRTGSLDEQGTSTQESTDTGEDTATGTSGNTSNSTGRSRSVSSDTPQTMLAGDADYASSAADSTSSTDTTSDATDERTNNHENSAAASGADTRFQNTDGEETVTGRQGVLGADAWAAFQRSLVNIDMMIIDDLKDLFMVVWNNGDEYYNYNYPFERW